LSTAPPADSRAIRLSLLFGLEVVVLHLVNIPHGLSFDWAFDDRGANLTIQYLLSLGYIPGLDFGYPYGLLPLAAGRVWFALFGLTPFACWIAFLVCELLTAVGIARFSAALQLGWSGIVVIFAALPVAVQPCYPNLAHALEAALIANALAEQAAGRLPRALALATAAIFSKPAMGYFYGLLIVLLLLHNWWRRRPGARLAHLTRMLLPAAVAALSLSTVLARMYGISPLLHQFLPTTGMRLYRASHFGLFAAGKTLLHPPGATYSYYLGSIAGFYMAGTLYLFWAGLASLRRLLSNDREQMIFTCALLQLMFIAVLFGNSDSWFYYSYVLVMGIAATSVWRRWSIYPVCALALLAIAWEVPYFGDRYRSWKERSTSRETAGLFSSTEERREWARVRKLIRENQFSRPAALLGVQGCGEILFPEFAKPVSAYLFPGEASAGDIQRKQAQVAAADFLVAPRSRDSLIDLHWHLDARCIPSGAFFITCLKEVKGPQSKPER